MWNVFVRSGFECKPRMCAIKRITNELDYARVLFGWTFQFGQRPHHTYKPTAAKITHFHSARSSGNYACVLHTPLKVSPDTVHCALRVLYPSHHISIRERWLFCWLDVKCASGVVVCAGSNTEHICTLTHTHPQTHEIFDLGNHMWCGDGWCVCSVHTRLYQSDQRKRVVYIFDKSSTRCRICICVINMCDVRSVRKVPDLKACSKIGNGLSVLEIVRNRFGSFMNSSIKVFVVYLFQCCLKIFYWLYLDVVEIFALAQTDAN